MVWSVYSDTELCWHTDKRWFASSIAIFSGLFKQTETNRSWSYVCDKDKDKQRDRREKCQVFPLHFYQIMFFSVITVRTRRCNWVSLPPHTQTHQRGHTFGLHPVKNTSSLRDKANILRLQIRVHQVLIRALKFIFWLMVVTARLNLRCCS